MSTTKETIVSFKIIEDYGLKEKQRCPLVADHHSRRLMD